MRSRSHILFLIALCAFSSPVAHAAAVPSEGGDCAMLREGGAFAHWFSMPNSRIVLNPSLSIVTPAGSPLRVSMEGLVSPIRANVAYYVGGGTVKIPALWAWQTVGPRGLKAGIIAGPSLDLSAKTAAKCPCEGVQVNAVRNGLRVTLEPERTWGAADIEAQVDLDRTPWMVVDAAQIDARWTMKVISDTEKVDIPLMADGLRVSSNLVDLRRATGWHGRKKFRLRLFPLGKPGDGITFTSVRFFGPSQSSPFLKEYDTVWYPHKMVSEAETGGRTSVATTGFSDESTIVQRIRVPATGKLMLTGQFASGKVRWDSQRRVLILQGDSFHAAVAVSRPVKWLGTFGTWDDWVNGSRASVPGSIWALEIESPKASDVVVSAYFAPTHDVRTDTVDRARRQANLRAFDAALGKRQAQWDELLGRAPDPIEFRLHHLDYAGTDPEDIRRMYYRAWAFLISNILPPMPEDGYPYPQVAAGKPSLWDEGHPKARPSAQWESIIGIQYLAMIDPRTAWSAFEGMMSLVDEQGTMAGEGLPARHFRTAWGLYCRTGDMEALRKLYPAMKRFLLWKFEYPHWILKRRPDPNSKAQGFVVHAMLDAQYAIRVASVLDMPEEAEFWREQFETFGGNYRRWFWDEPDSYPYAGYHVDTGQRTTRGSSYSLEGLVLPAHVMQRSRLDSLLSLMRAYFKPERPLIISGFTKQPGQNALFRGLCRYGEIDKAAALAEADMRDITRAGEFGEEYVQSSPPGISGVSPSLFGACLMIDAALWHNGVIVDDGLPVLVRLPYAYGVSGLKVMDGTLDVTYRASDELLLSGTGLEYVQTPDRFSAQAGADAPGLAGPFSTREQLVLLPSPEKWRIGQDVISHIGDWWKTGTPGRFRLACQTITWGATQKDHLPEVFSEIKAAGFEGVEIAYRHIQDIAPEKLKAMLDEQGLELAAIHGGNLGEADKAHPERTILDKLLEYTRVTDCRLLIQSGMGETEKQIEDRLNGLYRAAEKCRENGVKLLYHNHAGEFKDGGKAIQALLTGKGNALGICPDIGWVVRGGSKPIDLLNTAGSRVGAVHFKDFAETDKGHDFAILGTGIVPLRETADWLKKNAGGLWIIAEQDRAKEPTSEVAKRNAEFLRSCFGSPNPEK